MSAQRLGRAAIAQMIVGAHACPALTVHALGYTLSDAFAGHCRTHACRNPRDPSAISVINLLRYHSAEDCTRGGYAARANENVPLIVSKRHIVCYRVIQAVHLVSNADRPC